MPFKTTEDRRRYRRKYYLEHRQEEIDRALNWKYHHYGRYLSNKLRWKYEVYEANGMWDGQIYANGGVIRDRRAVDAQLIRQLEEQHGIRSTD